MKIKPIILSSALLFIGVSLSSCTTRTNFLGMPLMSMSEFNAKAPLAENGKPVTVSYCIGDKPESTKDVNAGVVDELLVRAEKTSKSKFIKDVNITLVQDIWGSFCFELEGTGINYAK